jgi:hypothetical protein
MRACIRGTILKHLLLAATLASTLGATLGATRNESISRHAAVIARVLSYELTLEERAGDSIEIAVVYLRGNPTSEANADDWFRALRDLLPVNVKKRPLLVSKVGYGIGDLTAAIDKGADVLLVTDGLKGEAASIAQIARARHVLTAGNSPDYVQTELTLCIVDEGEKTKILINLNTANSERIRFSSRLLALAQIIR